MRPRVCFPALILLHRRWNKGCTPNIGSLRKVRPKLVREVPKVFRVPERVNTSQPPFPELERTLKNSHPGTSVSFHAAHCVKPSSPPTMLQTHGPGGLPERNSKWRTVPKEHSFSSLTLGERRFVSITTFQLPFANLWGPENSENSSTPTTLEFDF